VLLRLNPDEYFMAFTGSARGREAIHRAVSGPNHGSAFGGPEALLPEGRRVLDRSFGLGLRHPTALGEYGIQCVHSAAYAGRDLAHDTLSVWSLTVAWVRCIQVPNVRRNAWTRFIGDAVRGVRGVSPRRGE